MRIGLNSRTFLRREVLVDGFTKLLAVPVF